MTRTTPCISARRRGAGPPFLRRGIQARCVLAALVLLIGCGSETRTPPSVEGSPALASVPLPDFERMEPRVRDQLQSSQDELDEALADEDTEPAALGRLFGKQGQLYLAYEFEQAALACFTNARRLAPQDDRWAYYLGHLLRKEGNPEESRAHYERALALNPDYQPTYIALAELFIEANRLDEAERLLNRARAMDASSARALIGLGQIASMRDEHDKAIEHLEAARKLAPEATKIYYPLGLAYRAQGDLEKARFFLERQGPERARRDDPLLDDLEDLVTGAHAFKYRGNEAYLQRRFQDALDAYQQAVDAAPDNPEFRVNLAAALTQMNDLASAVAQLREALRLDPEYVVANYNMATLLARQGRDQDAVAYYRKALAHNPGYKDAHFNLANALLRLRRFDEAALHFGRVVDLDPQNGTARYGQALALMRLRRWEAARTLLEDSYAAQPGNTRLANTLARLLAACPDEGLRDGPRALVMAQQLVASDRSVANVEVLAMALAAVGRFEEAIPLQEEGLAAVRQAGRQDLEASLATNLARYRKRQPARNPLGE